MSRGNWKAALLTMAMAVLALLAWFFYQRWYPWARYGVSYEVTHGESDSFDFLDFYIQRDGRRIRGPSVLGDDLEISYRYRQEDAIPDAIIRSHVWPKRHVILRLNMTDRTKPEFVVIEDGGLDLSYPPLGYYAY
ncbi:MAG TPA: hypothetical protein VGJ21_01680 [Terracidiphilus sp.]|jgi:hypothetical protein